MEPLAQRLRPRSLDEVCGQQHLLGKNQVFRRTVESGKIPNMIFYGPSGVGKTTVASIIAAGSGMQLHKLNGTTANTATGPGHPTATIRHRTGWPPVTPGRPLICEGTPL